MKKFMILLVVLALLLCGCNQVSNETVPTIPTDAVEPTAAEDTVPAATEATLPPEASTPEYTQQPMAAISMPLRTEYFLDGNNTIYYYTYQDIYLNVQDQQIADAIIIDFLSRREESHAISQSLAADAESMYHGDDNWNPYFFESVYSPTRVDLGVLSLFGRNVFYNGGNHPELECMAANYNMVTGEVLTLGSILTNADSHTLLCDQVTQQMAELKDTDRLFDDYADAVQQRFSREASYDEDWFFTTDGLCFFFAPYEVAPYTSGIITVEVPYDKLVSIISDEFFPAETDSSNGKIIAERFIDADIEGFTQIAEVPLSEEGEQIFLHCDGLIRNVSLDYGSWNDDGTVFTESASVFAAYVLSPGDGIIVTADIPDTMPTLRLSFDSADEHIILFISQSGKDGSILLLDDLI